MINKTLLLLLIGSICITSASPQYKTVEHPGVHSIAKPKPNSIIGAVSSVGALEKAFPCPDATAIAPCVCTANEEGLLTLNCSGVESNAALNAVFLNEFPVKEFYKFYVEENENLTELGTDVFQDVTFEVIDVIKSDNINLVSVYALEASKDRLKTIRISNGKLDENSFPLYNLQNYPVLDYLHLNYQRELTVLPPLISESMLDFSIYGASVSTLDPGE